MAWRRKTYRFNHYIFGEIPDPPGNDFGFSRKIQGNCTTMPPPGDALRNGTAWKAYLSDPRIISPRADHDIDQREFNENYRSDLRGKPLHNYFAENVKWYQNDDGAGQGSPASGPPTGAVGVDTKRGRARTMGGRKRKSRKQNYWGLTNIAKNKTIKRKNKKKKKNCWDLTDIKLKKKLY